MKITPRDWSILAEWADGARQVDLAARYGVSQCRIGQIVARCLRKLCPWGRGCFMHRHEIAYLLELWGVATAGERLTWRKHRGQLSAIP